MKNFNEWLISEGLNHPVIVVDVQPEYCRSKICRDIINFTTKQTGRVLMFVNAEQDQLTNDTIEEIKFFWEENSYKEINWNRFEIVDKGYGYFRSWMDNNIPESIIIATIRELYQQKKYDTRQLNLEGNLNPVQEKIKETIEEMKDDPIIVNWTSLSQLKYFSGSYIVGGGRNECLKEVQLLMNAFNIKYKPIDNLIY